MNSNKETLSAIEAREIARIVADCRSTSMHHAADLIEQLVKRCTHYKTSAQVEWLRAKDSEFFYVKKDAIARQQAADIKVLREALEFVVEKLGNRPVKTQPYFDGKARIIDDGEQEIMLILMYAQDRLAATDPNRVMDEPQNNPAWDALKVGEKYCDGEEK